jgi:hypothetical protein
MNSKAAFLLAAIIATADAYVWGTKAPSVQLKRDLTERVAVFTPTERLTRHPPTNVFHDLLESSQYCRWNEESSSDERIEIGSLVHHVTLPSPILDYCALQVIAGL